MENADIFVSATAPLTFHDFLDRMRHPQAADLVRSIKSFIVEFMSRAPDPDRDSESVQRFLSTTEGAFLAHPLFVNATDEELESAGEFQNTEVHEGGTIFHGRICMWEWLSMRKSNAHEEAYHIMVAVYASMALMLKKTSEHSTLFPRKAQLGKRVYLQLHTGLEKYLMTKLFSRAFAPLPEEIEHDQKLTEKMGMLQQFIRPEHLDIPANFRNESSWLLAQKELQKINTYKAPRDKLVCILNCCRVINNLLLNVSIAMKDNPPGADDFLPVLMFVVIKANPPQLHSNLLYISRYRYHSRLVSEAAYFYTNLVSAESFINTLEAKSLSMDEFEFEKQMQSARALLEVNTFSSLSTGTEKVPPTVDVPNLKAEDSKTLVTKESLSKVESGPGLSVQREDQAESRALPVESAALVASVGSAPVSPKENLSQKGSLSVSKLEQTGLPALLEADQSGQLTRDYPYLYASAGDLRVMDVESLLSDYKEVVLKYVALCKAVEGTGNSGKISRVSSPLLDLREAGNASKATADLERAIQSTNSENLVLSRDHAVVKEEQAPEVKRTIESEAVEDLFEGMNLRDTSDDTDLRRPPYRDTAREDHPSAFHHPQSGVDRDYSDETGPLDEHVVAEDTGHMAHEIFKSQDPPIIGDDVPQNDKQ